MKRSPLYPISQMHMQNHWGMNANKTEYKEIYCTLYSAFTLGDYQLSVWKALLLCCKACALKC